jgi:hypothetical protein
MISNNQLIVKWNLRCLADDLARRLEILERCGELWDRCQQSEEFLAPYGLQPDDEHAVTVLAWDKQCVDCGDVRDYYMVYGYIWRNARLQPNQCCCRGCLSLRLGRALEPRDFLMSSAEPAGHAIADPDLPTPGRTGEEMRLNESK